MKNTKGTKKTKATKAETPLAAVVAKVAEAQTKTPTDREGLIKIIDARIAAKFLTQEFDFTLEAKDFEGGRFLATEEAHKEVVRHTGPNPLGDIASLQS